MASALQTAVSADRHAGVRPHAPVAGHRELHAAHSRRPPRPPQSRRVPGGCTPPPRRSRHAGAGGGPRAPRRAVVGFDAHFTDVARRYGRQGAQIIADPSLFGSSIAQSLHVFPVFRAIENRTAFIMTDVAFNSAIVDPYGHVLELSITPEGSATTRVADVPLGSGNTLYSKYGNWLGWLSLAGLVFFAFFMPVTLRKESIS